jgi:hypothetical protein
MTRKPRAKPWEFVGNQDESPERARQVMSFALSGLSNSGCPKTQGDALGFRVVPFQGIRKCATSKLAIQASMRAMKAVTLI